MLPESLTAKMLEYFHDNNGQLGIDYIVKIMFGFVTWKGLYKNIEHSVRTCDNCQLNILRNFKYAV